MCGRKMCVLFITALLMQPISVIKAADSVLSVLREEIAKIQSYDVTYSTEFLTYPNPTRPDKANLPVSTDTSKRRDALAFGLGRRCETSLALCVYTISVVDWQTARSRGDKMSAIISGYKWTVIWIFFNPVCWEFSWPYLLRDNAINHPHSGYLFFTEGIDWF